MSEGDYRRGPAGQWTCPSCDRRVHPPRYDGGSWTCLCGAILKVGDENGTGDGPMEHVWWVGRSFRIRGDSKL
jgi:hypothetical protein